MRRNIGWAAGVAAFAAVLRLVFVLATRTDPVFRIPYLDGAFYHVWARSLAAGRGDFDGPYFLGPLYPYFVSGLVRLFGPDPIAVRLVQSLFGVACAVVVFALGRRCAGRRAGVLGAMAFAAYGPLAFYEGLVVMESLVTTLVLLSCAVLVTTSWRQERRGAAAGALLGLAALGRPTVLVLLPVAALVLGRRGFAAAMAAALLVLAPAVVRNGRAGSWTLTTNGGINFFAGNNERATGRFREPPGIRFFAAPILDVAASDAPLPPAVAARALNVRAVAGDAVAADSRLWAGRAWSWIASHPGDFAVLLVRKAWLVLQAREVAQIESYEYHARRLWPLRLFAVDFTWIWPLAALGLWHCRRRRVTAAAPLAAFAAGMLVPCIVFFVTSRYRLGALPFLCVFAGVGAAQLWAWIADRRIGSVLAALACLVPLGVATRLGAQPPKGAAGWEHAQMAERLYAAGDLEGCIGFQERAAAELPDRLEVQLNLALYWSERDAGSDLQRADALLRDLARRHPQSALVLFNLGAVLEQRGEVRDAVAAWREALRLEPGFEPARSRLLRYAPQAPTARQRDATNDTK